MLSCFAAFMKQKEGPGIREGAVSSVWDLRLCLGGLHGDQREHDIHTRYQ